jgi:hypothetical protein
MTLGGSIAGRLARRCAAILFAATALVLCARAASAASPSIKWAAESGRAVLTNGRLEMVVETKHGMNACSLRDETSGQVYADRDYQWGGGFPILGGQPAIVESEDGSAIVLLGRLGDLDVEQSFKMRRVEPDVIVERIEIRNATTKPVETAGFRCGFAKHLREGETWSADASNIHVSPAPYRRETNGQLQDFPLQTVAERGTTYAGWESPQPTPIWGAEGWVWSKGTSVLLVAKHNADAIEWSLMEPMKRGTETMLRFGGAGQWKHGHPEGSTRLKPRKSYRFGETRYQAIAGDWKQAYYAYRPPKTKAASRPRDTIRRCIGMNCTTINTSSGSVLPWAIRRLGTRRASTPTTRSCWSSSIPAT